MRTIIAAFIALAQPLSTPTARQTYVCRAW